MAEENRQNIITIRNVARMVFKRNSCTVPVEVESIASRFASIEEDDFPGAGDAIFIQKSLRGDKGVIILRNGMPEVRKRFTIAHEIGHHYIAWHIGSLGTFMCDTNTLNDNEPFEYYVCEKEANQFAAELLMPFDWATEVIKSSSNITEAMNAMAKAARVSFQSVAYRLPFVMKDGYEILVTDKISDITRQYFSGNSYPIDLRSKDEMTSVRRNRYAKAHDAFLGDTVEVRICYYGDVPYDRIPSRDEIKGFDAKQLLRLMIGICRLDNVSILHVAYELGRRMSGMMLLYIRNMKSGDYQFVHGQGSKIRISHEDDEKNTVIGYSDLAGDQSSGALGDFSFTFWCFANKHDMNTVKKLSVPSIQILEEILDEEYWEESESARIKRCINGIIGAANNERRKQNYGEHDFYNFLKLKFSLRVDLEDAVKNDKFDAFLAQKVLELYGRDVGV